MTDERWLPVVGYEGRYEVSDLGRVRSLDRIIYMKDGRQRPKRGQLMRPLTSSRQPYLGIHLWRDGVSATVRIHNLVLEAFVGPRPDGTEACHGPVGPRDNSLPNLRWDSKVANAKDKMRDGNNYQANKTHCKRNHEFTELNTRYTTTGGRQCRECKRLREGSAVRRGPYGSKYDRKSPTK